MVSKRRPDGSKSRRFDARPAGARDVRKCPRMSAFRPESGQFVTSDQTSRNFPKVPTTAKRGGETNPIEATIAESKTLAPAQERGFPPHRAQRRRRNEPNGRREVGSSDAGEV
jgi:hypothetical protein